MAPSFDPTDPAASFDAPNGFRLRGATASDADVIARIHVAAWRAAYAGLVPDEHLAGSNEVEGARRWREGIESSGLRCFVAERVGLDSGPDAQASGADATASGARSASGTTSAVGRSGETLPPDALLGWIAVGAVAEREGVALEPGLGEVRAIYVDPARQRAGVGRSLMEPGARALRADGLRAIVLWVFEANAAARAFHERLGYRLDVPRRMHEVGGRSLSLVRYRLSGSRERR